MGHFNSCHKFDMNGLSKDGDKKNKLKEGNLRHRVAKARHMLVSLSHSVTCGLNPNQRLVTGIEMLYSSTSSLNNESQ
jgi:hypothetical protein